MNDFELEGRLRSAAATYERKAPDIPDLERRILARVAATPREDPGRQFGGRLARPAWHLQILATAALLTVAVVAAILIREARLINQPQPITTPSPSAVQQSRSFAPTELALDAGGDLYASDCAHGQVYKISHAGAITAIAGTGLSTTPGLGDGGPAIQAFLLCPYGLALDRNGGLVIADDANNRVRRIARDGMISTIVGSGPTGHTLGRFGGDGGAASNAYLNDPVSVLFDKDGNLYIGDRDNGAIRKVDPRGIITTIAGTGKRGYSGDGGPATRAQLDQPEGMVFDTAGNLYFTDSANNRIRRIDTHGTITTVAGTGVAGYSGNGGPATEAQMQPDDVVFDPAGNLYVAEGNDHVVRMIDTNGIIRTTAGTGKAGCSGYGGAATAAQLTLPLSPVLDPVGNLYITDQGCNVVLRIDRNGIIRIFAGPA